MAHSMGLGQVDDRVLPSACQDDADEDEQAAVEPGWSAEEAEERRTLTQSIFQGKKKSK